MYEDSSGKIFLRMKDDIVIQMSMLSVADAIWFKAILKTFCVSKSEYLTQYQIPIDNNANIRLKIMLSAADISSFIS